MAAKPASTPRVVFVGGGFGGAFAARALRRLCPSNLHIELINDENYFVFQPLLPEVASGTINAQDAVTPHRALLGPDIHFRLAEVIRVDVEARTLAVLQGQRKRLVEVPWDHLVLAGGTTAALSRVPGLEEHALRMKDLGDAFTLRNHVLHCLEWADITRFESHKDRALCFVVVGGGFSGVETIGELADMARRALRYYRNVRADELRFVLIQRDGRLLPELPEALGGYAQRHLERRGIEVRLNCALSAATATYVELDGIERLSTATVVATIGSGPTPLAASLPQCERGRLATDEHLRLRDSENIWALGDAALIPLPAESGDAQPRHAPPTAQFAVREAKLLARNIDAAVAGRSLERFDYRPLGAMASIGGYRGVAQLFGVNLTGFLAWFMWRGFYLMMLPGIATRLRVSLDWILDYIIPRSIVELQQDRRPAVRFAHYGTGDHVLRPGQLLDGFYLVLSGRLELRMTAPDGEEFQREVGPQEHIGDRLKSFETVVRSEVRALEPTRVMIIDWRDVLRLRQSFKYFDNYLSQDAEQKYPERFYGKV